MFVLNILAFVAAIFGGFAQHNAVAIHPTIVQQIQSTGSTTADPYMQSSAQSTGSTNERFRRLGEEENYMQSSAQSTGSTTADPYMQFSAQSTGSTTADPQISW
ncbi:MAG: hypothetical protein ACYDA5_09365 [Vulcanimicrobiaceae bacterium]